MATSTIPKAAKLAGKGKKPVKKHTRAQIEQVMRTAWHSAYVVELHAGLLHARENGLLPDWITDETIAWHSTKLIRDESENLFECLDILGQALGVEDTLYDNLDEDAEFRKRYLVGVQIEEPRETEGGAAQPKLDPA